MFIGSGFGLCVIPTQLGHSGNFDEDIFATIIHYNPLLIRNCFWILTVHKARILRKKPFEKTFLDFKKWVKNIQTAGYNGARTVFKNLMNYFLKLFSALIEWQNL